jgi:uncharacterized protein
VGRKANDHSGVEYGVTALHAMYKAIAVTITTSTRRTVLRPRWLAILLSAVGVGVVGGVTAGLLGTSPGGAVVVLSILLLGADQHVAQGISLAVQIPPTSLSGIRRYRAEGHRCPLPWLLWLAAGMLLGGAVGAFVAAHVSSSVLRWSYVVYLIALDLLLILRSKPSQVASDTAPASRTTAA